MDTKIKPNKIKIPVNPSLLFKNSFLISFMEISFNLLSSFYPILFLDFSLFLFLCVYSQVDFRTQLLHALDNEADAYMKARICDIVGELANFVIDDWAEILPYTHHCLQVFTIRLTRTANP